MNLTELFSKFDFHDSYIEYFEYNSIDKIVKCYFNLGDWQQIERCDIEFINVNSLSIQADNSEFEENALVSSIVSSSDGEYFKGFFDEGFGKPGKVIEIQSEQIKYSIY